MWHTWHGIRLTARLFLCLDKERLIRAYIRSVTEWNCLHSVQLAALKRGDDYKFTLELTDAAERVQNAKYAILVHRQTHGC